MLRDQGVEVVVASADVAREDEVARVLADVRRSMPPLRGVIHAAMVLDDAPLRQLDAVRFRTVAAPKVQGAWNLHRLTLDDPLDIFVLFSSAAVVLVNTRQGNYVAANSFLDALAHHRRLRGGNRPYLLTGLPWPMSAMWPTIPGSPVASSGSGCPRPRSGLLEGGGRDYFGAGLCRRR